LRGNRRPILSQAKPSKKENHEQCGSSFHSAPPA
jgi:hypothetical protein